MQEKEITHRQKKIFYRAIGEGPVVVLLHGVPFDGNLWKNQFNASPGYKLIIPDLPGSGRSEIIEDMSMEGMAECVKEIIVHETNARPPLTPPTGENDAQPLLMGEPSLLLETSTGEFYQDADSVTYRLLKNYVSEHRKNPTQAEDFLWQQLRENKLEGYAFRRQHIIGSFIVDFICLAKKLIIEVDGLIHQLPENKTSDEARTAWLGMKGYTVVRFTNEEVLFNVENCLSRIRQTLHQLHFAPKKTYETSKKVNEEIDKQSSISEVSAVDSSPVGGSRKGALVIGHSMGGYITLALAEKYPELLNGFGLFHSTAYADAEERKEGRRKTIKSIE
ncbi:MAG TPA: alpha/beta fold hydrolase, partial [Flavisolibacter sp.]|nr:alpha/beta fold hydrolase [Flavisolibacter sp.]